MNKTILYTFATVAMGASFALATPRHTEWVDINFADYDLGANWTASATDGTWTKSAGDDSIVV